MRPQPRIRRRRFTCRCVDKYLLAACGAFLVFVLSINLVARSIEEQINISFAESARDRGEAEGGDGTSSLALAPPPWSPASINGIDLTRRAMAFVASAIASVDTLFAQDSGAAVELLDVALLVRAREPEGLADILEAFATGAIKDAADAEALAEAVETLDGVQVVLRARGFTAEADVCEQQRRRIVRERGDTVSAAPSNVVRWAFDRAPPISTPHALAANVTWQPKEPLQVEALEYLLDNWIARGGARNTSAAPLRSAYARTVGAIVRSLFRTVRTPAANYTFLPSPGLGVFPPRVCGLPAVLSRGARHNAHRAITTDAAAAAADGDGELTGDQVLQAAEALAATCLRLYADPAVGHFGAPLQYTFYSGEGRNRPPFRMLDAGNDPRDVCAMPLLLLRSCYELFEYTQDRVYAAWAAYVMSTDASHCTLVAPGLDGAIAVERKGLRRYAAELRYFALLFQSLECNLYRGAVGTRGACLVRSASLVSPLHHLVPLAAQ